MPAQLAFDVAGALPVAGVTAWMSVVELGQLASGRKALILGASGGVEQLALQIAKRVVGGFAVAVCSGKNPALVHGLGTDVVLDYERADALEQAKPYAPYRVLGRPTRERLAPVVAAVAAGQLTRNLAERFGLAEAEQAHQQSRTGRVTGKLVLLV